MPGETPFHSISQMDARQVQPAARSGGMLEFGPGEGEWNEGKGTH